MPGDERASVLYFFGLVCRQACGPNLCAPVLPRRVSGVLDIPVCFALPSIISSGSRHYAGGALSAGHGLSAGTDLVSVIVRVVGNCNWRGGIWWNCTRRAQKKSRL